MNTGNVRLLTPGQQQKMNAAVSRALGPVFERMTVGIAQRWIGNNSALEKFMLGLLPPEKTVETSPALLTFAGYAGVGPLVGEFNPKGFFRNNNNNPEVKLYIWGDFVSHVLNSATSVRGQPAATLSAHVLTKNMYDSEIRRELPRNHLFSIGDLWVVGSLLELQPKAGKGILLTNGHANLFYFQVGEGVFAVSVRWRADRGKWLVDAWGLGGFRWFEGHRVFSRNA